ncbi:hypothetical protein XhhCFBP4925_07725 [Xanthomonas hortorum pv. hederae]|nr:hypothetical protein XhhCFBP4925_07725 [Xanthomonas hortorum pv. hederae]PUF00591.1 hypothetical protein C7T87_07325 [Xanthomonas hortorum pv. hederae]
MRGRSEHGAVSGVGTRRESVCGGSVAASMPLHGPAPGYVTAPPVFAAADRKAMHSTGVTPADSKVKPGTRASALSG